MLSIGSAAVGCVILTIGIFALFCIIMNGDKK
jgi:hypothetical protein